MPTIASLILLLALAAPAPLAAGERMMLAQAETTEQEPATPGEEDEAVQPDEEEAPAPDEVEPQSEEEAQPAEEAPPPEEAQPEEGAQPQDEGQPDGEAQPEQEAQPSPESEAQPGGAEAAPETAPTAEPAEDDRILRSTAVLPGPVRETWQALVEAARSGQVERLQPIMEAQAQPPMVAFDDVGDPIAYLKSLSGDAEGREILAILLEVLQAGFLHVDQGTPQEMYLWPYFARFPIEDLTARQMVELFTLLTAGDYQDMLSYGAYIFFRVGIAPDGRWMFFVAGD